ncbi:hypothetical protein RFI_35148 [Reticulomyxa filosa]|uniref:Uncharacterized protein n=1 Tax=Reticulomyxa filosa TaxID=46433 RepID=X6LK01_RETFI|nr:hypothetical protein RFI_35148 [Reticulomyxa filosa]|eukprot:ETO02288.1 hypothetical protein RFI_35148 [Reticulomyxa filosa]
MLLQQNFPQIEKEIILQAWNCCDEDIDGTNEILHCINDNRLITKSTCPIIFFSEVIFHNDQKHSLLLLEDFGNRVNKTEILNLRKQFDQISYGTKSKLEKICFSRDINREELMIVRSIYLCILWNPKVIKYRQISYHNLYKNLRPKCNQLCVNFVETLDDINDECEER